MVGPYRSLLPGPSGICLTLRVLGTRNIGGAGTWLIRSAGSRLVLPSRPRAGRFSVTLDQDVTASATRTERSARVAMTGRQRLVLVVLLTASFTLAVDFSILNVALPAIGADVGLGLDHLQWIATAVALCAAGCTLSFGRIADIFGRRRMFLSGMAVLGVASLVGGLAQ